MQMRTIEIVVGAFMVLGLAALAILAVQVSGFTTDAHGGTYSVYARFGNLGGLKVRSKVSVAGVYVGQVAEITLDQESFTALVSMEIDDEFDRLPVDTVGAIQTEGLLGGKFVALSIGAEEDILAQGDEIIDTQPPLILEELIGKFLMNAL